MNIIQIIKDIKIIVEIKVEYLKTCHKLIVLLNKINKYHIIYNYNHNHKNKENNHKNYYNHHLLNNKVNQKYHNKIIV